METPIQERKLAKVLISFTLFTIVLQIFLLWTNSITTDLFDTLFRSSISWNVLKSAIFVLPFLYFLIAHIFLYALGIFFIWYTAKNFQQLFKLSANQTFYFGISLWVVSVIFITVANSYYVPHSFFASLVKKNITSPETLLGLTYLTGCLLLGAFLISLIVLIKDFYNKNYRGSHIFILIFFSMLMSLHFYYYFAAIPKKTYQASTNKPNVILVGVDAVRPDFLDYYPHGLAVTPFIDKFLQSAITFNNSYTPLARTFPSWTTILTGRYPKHTHARGNNIRLDTLNLQKTLPTYFRQAGYETVFGTDDTRFNNITQQYGFDKIITPPMGLNDFLLGNINDFPLSNLIVTTSLGRILFPYSYANHGVAHTYDPKNYLQLMAEALRQREARPLFLAVHFTISHWPYFWFNDHQSSEVPQLHGYTFALAAADKQLADFFKLLEQNDLLTNSIVVLLSDHGVSLGLPGDRLTNPKKYQGNPVNLKKLAAMRYNGRDKFSVDFKKDWGIDTTYGYGSDVLSLKQTHNLFAIKAYGVDIGKPHAVKQAVSTLDITPTILDLLNFKKRSLMDGISLRPLLQGKNQIAARPFYFESTYSVEEIEKEKISPEKVLIESLQLYDMDRKTGLIYYKPLAEKAMLQHKQEAVVENGWLLAHYPHKQKLTFSPRQSTFVPEISPGYFVLVNLRTGGWTTELNSSFAKQAPLTSLRKQLFAFYGKERSLYD